jgi:hypothetical protein
MAWVRQEEDRMPWSAERNDSNDRVLAYFARKLQAAYMQGRSDAIEQLDNAEALSDAELKSLEFPST